MENLARQNDLERKVRNKRYTDTPAHARTSDINPSFSKPFGTHTFYQGGSSRTSPSYLKNRSPHERGILQGIRDTFESLRNVKVVYIVFTWLP